jgi:hypothetical protein
MQNDVAQRRDPILTTLAVLMGLLALSNMSKPIAQTLAPESTAGFVFLGQRLHGIANAIIGPLFGLLLAAYAYGVWSRKKWVLPLAAVYAVYVVLNLILFTVNPPADDPMPLIGGIIYAAVAIGVSGGGAFYLYRHQEQLS